MSERERWAPLSLTLAGIPFRGVSIAGRETWFHVPSLDLAFDVGRSPSEIVPVPNLFLSHAHLDHAGGLAYWASQRRLLRLPPGRVFTDPAAVPAWRQILALHGGLEGVAYDVTVDGLGPGDSVDLRKDLSVSAFRADHRVPTVGFVASEVRRRLVPGWQGRPEEEIRAAILGGEEVTKRSPRPLFAFSGDTGVGIFESRPARGVRGEGLPPRVLVRRGGGPPARPQLRAPARRRPGRAGGPLRERGARPDAPDAPRDARRAAPDHRPAAPRLPRLADGALPAGRVAPTETASGDSGCSRGRRTTPGRPRRRSRPAPARPSSACRRSRRAPGRSRA